ncbi:MAG: DUF2971 domain-containing protein, partial [Oxalicibacterium faecigallinarum]|uniref:DUF2971 domain-containing protein n=1 Tax=Oxalicibacterium faecigallinarum TaxID=573741 RepID=UPI002809624F
ITDYIGVYSSPVAYFYESKMINHFSDVVDSMEAEIAYVHGLGEKILMQTVFNMFRFAALCTKHPGFKEEQEWRIIYSPPLSRSPLVKTKVEVVRGKPQVVQKLMLKNHPESGLYGVSPAELLHKIIIGPCDDPYVVSQAFRTVLEEKRIPTEGKIRVSGIPLRHF